MYVNLLKNWQISVLKLETYDTGVIIRREAVKIVQILGNVRTLGLVSDCFKNTKDYEADPEGNLKSKFKIDVHDDAKICQYHAN